MIRNVTISKIKYNSYNYVKGIELRNRTLRIPIGLTLSQEQIEREQGPEYIHYSASIGETVVGILVLRNFPDYFQIFHVAVDPIYQGNKIGSRLLLTSENDQIYFGFTRSMVFSRENVVAFYLSLNYELTGQEKMLLGIRHLNMTKYF